jgi:hypothetical protein
VKSFFGSIILLATGVALVWGVNGSVGGISVNTLGGGLILLGLIVAFVGLVWWARHDSVTGRPPDDHTVRGA